MIDGTKIEQDWLKVERNFNETYTKNQDLGCATDAQGCVMLHTEINEKLKLLSH